MSRKRGMGTEYEAFLLDLIRHEYGERVLSGELSVHDALEEFFQTDSREVYFFRVVKAAKFFTRNLALLEGQTGLLRIDREPTGKIRMDVQLHIESEIDYVFFLTQMQKQVIKDSVEIEYTSKLSGKDPARARQLKRYHEKFVEETIGCPFKFTTAAGLLRPGFRNRVRRKGV